VNQCEEDGWSPLLVASSEGHPEIVSVLLDVPNIDVNLADSVGTTPLYAACHQNNLDVVKLLVRARGINVNQCREDGWSPLHVASYNGNAEIVSVLLAAGAKVHLKNDKGSSALDEAIQFKHTAVTALLLDHITQTEGAEAADKTEVGAVLGAIVIKVVDKNDEEEKRLERLESATLNDSRQGPLFSSRMEILRAAFKG